MSGQVISLKWAFHHPDNHLIKSIYKLNTFEKVEELEDAVSHASAPGFNVSAIDSSGNIGWHVMGKIPKRPKGVIPFIPLEGHHGKHEYLGYLNIKENPHSYNPQKGFIVSANYYPEEDFGFNHFGNWQPEERYARLNNLLAKKISGAWTKSSLCFLIIMLAEKKKLYQ